MMKKRKKTSRQATEEGVVLSGSSERLDRCQRSPLRKKDRVSRHILLDQSGAALVADLYAQNFPHEPGNTHDLSMISG